MSWSDHKDDKSRFDGWREFLNERVDVHPRWQPDENEIKLIEPFPRMSRKAFKDWLKEEVKGKFKDGRLPPARESNVIKVARALDKLEYDLVDNASMKPEHQGKYEVSPKSLALGKYFYDPGETGWFKGELKGLYLGGADGFPEEVAAELLGLPKIYDPNLKEGRGQSPLSAVNESQLQQIIREELDNVKEWIDDWDDLPDPAGVERYDPLKPAIDALAGDEEELPDPERRLARDIDRLENLGSVEEPDPELIELLFYEVKDRDSSESLEDVFKDIVGRQKNPTYVTDEEFRDASPEAIWSAIQKIETMSDDDY